MNFNEFLSECCDRIGNKNFVTLLEVGEESQNVQFKSLTGREFFISVKEISERLELSGLRNHRVAFLSENSLDLLVTYFACLMRGSQVCILDEKLTFPEKDQILNDFCPDFLFVDSKKWSEAPQFKVVKSLATKLIQIQDLKNIPLGLTSGVGIPNLENSQKILVYTSGTSGTPKGVVLDISSIYFEVKSLRSSFVRDFSKRKCLSILPINHIYGVTAALFTSLWSDQEIILTQSLAPMHIRLIIQERKPDYLYVVPQFLSLIKNRVMEGIKSKPRIIQLIVRGILFLNRYFKSPWLANRFFSEIRNQIGPSIEFSISGGAPLGEDIFDFFEAINMPVCNGYGLSETSPVISCNNLRDRRRGSVGKIIDGVEVKIEPATRQILVRGPNVFEGYYKRDDLTKEAFTEDGWFKTGDLGYIDPQGFLFVSGRSKNMIVLPSGKKIQPEEVENHFSKLDFIKNNCLIYAGSKGKNPKLYLIVELNEGQSLEKKNVFIETLVQHSQHLAPFKRPQEYRFQTKPLPITTTLKVKRFMVQKEIENES